MISQNTDRPKGLDQKKRSCVEICYTKRRQLDRHPPLNENHHGHLDDVIFQNKNKNNEIDVTMQPP